MATHQCAERAFPGFVRTDFAAQRMPAENFPERKRGDVGQFRRENDEAKKAVGVARVGEKSEMAEHPADVDESDNRERHSLQFAAGAIAQNRNEQNQRDREHRHRDKESVPAGARFFAARMRDERRDSDRDDSGINRAGHPPIAIQTRRAREFLESENREQRDADDGRNASEKNDDANRSPAIRIHDQYVSNIDAVSFFKTNRRKPRTAPPSASEIKTMTEVSAKNWIVQRDLRRHHCLSCSAAVIRFKRTTIV